MKTITPDNSFKIVYQPLNPVPKRRYFICFRSLVLKVGSHNANKSFLRALNSTTDKYRVRLRKYGIIDFYSK